MKRDEMINVLKPVVDFVQERTGYLIFLGDETDGRLVVGTVKNEGIKYKVAYIHFKTPTEALHEMGHLLATPGVRPVSKVSGLIRELEAWRAAEELHHKFDIPFDVDVFDAGLGSYVMELILSDERPPFGWLSQLLGEGYVHNSNRP